MVVLPAGASGEEASPDTVVAASPSPALFPGIDVFQMISGATVEQRARMSRFVANKYPKLGSELITMMSEQYPDVLGDLSAYVEHIMRTKYTEVPGVIVKQLQAAPAVLPAVEEVITAKYPDLLTDLVAAAGLGDDMQLSVAQLIQDKYPLLLQDVLQVLTTKFPSLLVSIEHEVISRHPQMLIDVAGMVQKRYPGFANDVLIFLLTKYPELLPELVAVLNSVPESEAPRADTVPAGTSAVEASPATTGVSGDTAPADSAPAQPPEE
jgi:hypothetical protein